MCQTERQDPGAGAIVVSVIQLQIGNKVLLSYCYWITNGNAGLQCSHSFFGKGATETSADLRQGGAFG